MVPRAQPRETGSAASISSESSVPGPMTPLSEILISWISVRPPSPTHWN